MTKTESFYSNCFIEAMKAKLKHPFKTKLTIVRRSEAGCPHFLWSDGQYDYDFGVERQLECRERLWFEGHIRQRALGFNEKYKKRMEENWRKKENNS